LLRGVLLLTLLGLLLHFLLLLLLLLLLLCLLLPEFVRAPLLRFLRCLIVLLAFACLLLRLLLLRFLFFGGFCRFIRLVRRLWGRRPGLAARMRG